MDGQAKVSLILELKEKIRAGLNRAKSYVNENVQEMKDSLSSFKTSYKDAFDSMGSEIPGFTRALDMIRNPFVLATAAVLALGTAYGGTVSKALDWEKGLAKINVTAQLSKTQLDKLSDQLLNIGAKNTTPLSQIPDAFNQIVSAGLDVKTSLATLDPVLKASKAGFTDLGTTADATVSVMNSSGIMDAKKVLDVLFATVNKGKAEFKDVSQYLPRIIPNARAAGLALGETAGAWAFLTAQGRNAEQSTTGLLNLFRQISTPTVAKSFRDIGVAVYDTHGKIRPLIGIIEDLKHHTDGLSDRKKSSILSSLGLDAEAIGAVNSMTQDVGKLRSFIDFTTNSQGQLKEAVDNSHTSMDSWRLIVNGIVRELIKVGQTALPIISELGDALLSVGRNIGLAIPYVKSFAVGLGAAGLAYAILNPNIILNTVVSTAAAVANGALTAAMWALNLAMDANPIGLIIAGIGLLTSGFYLAYQKSETFRAGISGIMAAGRLLLDVFLGLGKVIVGTFTLNPSMIRSGLEQGASAVKSIMDGGISKSFNVAYDASIKESRDKVKHSTELKEDNPFAVKPGITTPKTPGKLDNSGEGDSVSKITGGAKQIKNLTVNIDSFIKGGINTNNTQGLNGLTADQIQKWLEEALQRTLRNLETSYS